MEFPLWEQIFTKNLKTQAKSKLGFQVAAIAKTQRSHVSLGWERLLVSTVPKIEALHKALNIVKVGGYDAVWLGSVWFNNVDSPHAVYMTIFPFML